jgi:hypothetical protein
MQQDAEGFHVSPAKVAAGKRAQNKAAWNGIEYD